MGVDEGGWGEREERELGDLEGQWGKGGRREERGDGGDCKKQTPSVSRVRSQHGHSETASLQKMKAGTIPIVFDFLQFSNLVKKPA